MPIIVFQQNKEKNQWNEWQKFAFFLDLVWLEWLQWNGMYLNASKATTLLNRYILKYLLSIDFIRRTADNYNWNETKKKPPGKAEM